MKLCFTCNEKPRYKTTSYCRGCRNKKAREWAAGSGREGRTKSARRYRRKLRGDILEAYGNKCQCCGEDEKHFLELDHINNDGYEHRVRRGNTWGIYIEVRREGFPKDYQLLCSNCNTGRARNNGICPHKLNSG